MTTNKCNVLQLGFPNTQRAHNQESYQEGKTLLTPITWLMSLNRE